MIIKLLILFVFIIFSVFAGACEVYLPHHVMLLGSNSDFEHSIKHTDCNNAALQDISTTLNSVEGKITSIQLSEILKSKGHIVGVQPTLIQVQHLEHLVREQLMLPPGVQLRSSEAIDSTNHLVLDLGDKVEVECNGCLYGAQQPLNVKIVSFGGTSKTVVVRADFKKMVRAYRVIGFHPAFSDIRANSLKEEFVESIPHTDLITNLEHIHFYKLNKPLRSGDLLKLSDLNALSLVKAGLKTEVIIENSFVKLKTVGISRSNGVLGEFVEVFHPQKNKKYQGKVIDINKVLVEL